MDLALRRSRRLLNLTMAVIAWSMVDDQDSAAHGRTARSTQARIEWRVVALSTPLFLYSYSYGAVSSFSAVLRRCAWHPPRVVYLTTLALVTPLLTRPFPGALATGSAIAASFCRVSSSCAGMWR